MTKPRIEWLKTLEQNAASDGRALRRCSFDRCSAS
jgi:hypothetical protein